MSPSVDAEWFSILSGFVTFAVDNPLGTIPTTTAAPRYFIQQCFSSTMRIPVIFVAGSALNGLTAAPYGTWRRVSIVYIRTLEQPRIRFQPDVICFLPLYDYFGVSCGRAGFTSRPETRWSCSSGWWPSGHS